MHPDEFQEDCPFGRSFSAAIRVVPCAPDFGGCGGTVTVGTDMGEGEHLVRERLQRGADDLKGPTCPHVAEKAYPVLDGQFGGTGLQAAFFGNGEVAKDVF